MSDQGRSAHPEPMTLPGVEIYTDGGCEPNPGPGGYGVVLLHPKKRLECSGGFRLTTNNRMEIYAAIKGLELLKQPCRVIVYSDSQYLVKAMTQGWVLEWKRKDWWRTNKERAVNVDLWEKLLELCGKHQVEFRWVQGHAGNKENERCDRLSCDALRQADLPVDEGYENKPEPGERPRLTQEAGLLEMRDAGGEADLEQEAQAGLLFRVLSFLHELPGDLRGEGGQADH